MLGLAGCDLEGPDLLALAALLHWGCGAHGYGAADRMPLQRLDLSHNDLVRRSSYFGGRRG